MVQIYLDEKQVIIGILIAVLIFGVVGGIIYAYESGRSNAVRTSTVIYRDRVVEKPTTINNTIVQPTSIDIKMNKTGECIMVSRPGDKDALMRCSLT